MQAATRFAGVAAARRSALINFVSLVCVELQQVVLVCDSFFVDQSTSLQVLFTPGLGPGLVDGMASWIKDHASGGGASAGKQAAAGAADEAAGGAAAAAKM